ncbi:hypothetical protein [Solirubrobacter deserti]|uniref:hypothetical protein n=1 Tax=Solirubrobacter deserti TaxID=2282478 RepID=UPI0022CD2E97|nr:hypothetical protein [Solirubrobacter deserti]
MPGNRSKAKRPAASALSVRNAVFDAARFATAFGSLECFGRLIGAAGAGVGVAAERVGVAVGEAVGVTPGAVPVGVAAGAVPVGVPAGAVLEGVAVSDAR